MSEAPLEEPHASNAVAELPPAASIEPTARQLRWGVVVHQNDFAASGMIQNALFLVLGLRACPSTASVDLLTLDEAHVGEPWGRGALPDEPAWRLQAAPLHLEHLDLFAEYAAARFDALLWATRSCPTALQPLLRRLGVKSVDFECGSLLMWHTAEWLHASDGRAREAVNARHGVATLWVIPYLGTPQYKEYIRGLAGGAMAVRAVPHLWNATFLHADYALRARVPLPTDLLERGRLLPPQRPLPPFYYTWTPPLVAPVARPPATVLIMESQSVWKNAWLALVVCERFLQTGGALGGVRIFSCADLHNAKAMLSALPLVSAIATLEPRRRFVDVACGLSAAPAPTVALSMPLLHPDNYTYYEFAVTALPFVTNSATLAAAGPPLHYSACDAQESGGEVGIGLGVGALRRAIDDAWQRTGASVDAALALGAAWVRPRCDPSCPTVIAALEAEIQATLLDAPDEDSANVRAVLEKWDGDAKGQE